MAHSSLARRPTVAVIGGGPAGLIAADHLAARGSAVTIYERMPSAGRKLLMAGRGGLNLTHSEPFSTFLDRYGPARAALEPAIAAFGPAALRAWCAGLGEDTFVGSSGRVFPRSMKASPLLRALLRRLDTNGAALKTRHDWRGFDAAGDLVFSRPGGTVTVPRPDAVLLALGGASWPRLGSTGSWADILADLGVPVSPFRPSNCGFKVSWSDHFRDRFAGTPLKRIGMTHGGRSVRGEAVVTADGLEGGAVYALSAGLRDAITATGPTLITIDLRPDLDPAALSVRLERPRGKQSASTFLRKTAGLAPVATGLLREAGHLPDDPAALAALIKAVPITMTAAQPLERAISTAGGIALDAVDDGFMLRQLPGIYVAGEMLDWEAPTGGYLLQASFATGLAAARAIAERLQLAPAEGVTP